jgi:hypothetical protein
MNEHLLWRTEPGGVLAAEIGELRLVVRRHAPDAWREATSAFTRRSDFVHARST